MYFNFLAASKLFFSSCQLGPSVFHRFKHLTLPQVLVMPNRDTMGKDIESAREGDRDRQRQSQREQRERGGGEKRGGGAVKTEIAFHCTTSQGGQGACDELNPKNKFTCVGVTQEHVRDYLEKRRDPVTIARPSFSAEKLSGQFFFNLNMFRENLLLRLSVIRKERSRQPQL